MNRPVTDGLPLQQRYYLLQLRGSDREYLNVRELDWEVMACRTPYQNLQELFTDFSLQTVDRSTGTIEVTAFPVVAIAEDSEIRGTTARIKINLCKGLDIRNANINYRVLEKGTVTKRASIRNDELAWQDAPLFQQGEVKWTVPPGCVIHCIACYANMAQHHYWIADTSTAQNPFRAIHHAFDPNLEILQELVVRAQTRGANSRDLEIAVSWLLWLLGLSATHLGAVSKTSDAPDLVAYCPSGNLFVIECTTGILKEDSKLPHLIERTEKVRRSLAECGHQHLKVLPLLVTTKSRPEVKGELEQAHQHGVLVSTIEDLPQAINRTLLYPNPNAVFTEAEETLTRLQNPPNVGLNQPI